MKNVNNVGVNEPVYVWAFAPSARPDKGITLIVLIITILYLTQLKIL